MWALAVPSETSSVSRKYEVLGVDGEPIPHLYSAGELGGICAFQYNSGGNLGECMVFGKIVVRVTYADGTIQDVEVLEQNETPEFGGAALEELPSKVVEANSTDIDGVTGATITSKAFLAAVQDAIAKA